MFTLKEMDDEPLGLTLARCYRLARARANATDDLPERNKIESADAALAQEENSSHGCACAQPVIQSS